MADAAVEFLLNNLKDLLVTHSHLITDTRNQIECLEKDLRLLNAFLKDSVKKRITDETTKVLVQNIRDAVYEVEDVIDAFITKVMERKSESGTLMSFISSFKPSVDLHGIVRKVEEVSKKVERARSEFVNLRIDEDRFETLQVRLPREKDVVGFADVTDELISRLTEETDYFDIISLIGMLGLGKTTLAWKVMNDPKVILRYPTRIWLYISQEFSDREIFVAILKEMDIVPGDINEKRVEELARMVAAALEGKSFLIVMDDVWSRADWDRLRIALPHGNKKGKVLITSRMEDVGRYASNPRDHHELRFFKDEESWELLRLEALHQRECPSELTSVGQMIAKDCKGLPLAVVVIGGILATMFSASNLNATMRDWETVSSRVSAYFSDDPADRMKKFISLSYANLPYHLRACFLYLGMFPEDYEIPASKLIRMWIGEGFIHQNDDYSLEETAQKYLEELINRNLVRIDKFKPNGKVKTCRIHDALRDFCRIEAGRENENFLQEIRYKGGFTPPIDDLGKYRRLSVHSNCLNFISSKPSGPRVRSFVCFPKYEFILPSEYISHILEAFKLLRVLDVKPIKFTRLSSNMYKLVHLRYIVLSFNLDTLPSDFSLLWNIQTLIVHTMSRTLKVKADIWKMNQLRHFKTNASATLPKPSKNIKHNAELQTLGTISVESCTAAILVQACNLKKLGIRGRLAFLMEGQVQPFDRLGEMKYIEKLKLINDVYPRPPSVGQLDALPHPYQFPSNLRSLTLVATFLDWNCMSTLGLLQKLEVLKLKDKAFMGSDWETVEGGFRQLEFLHIEETDLAVWNASSHHFPRLRSLVLKNCDKLRGIPIPMGDIASLQMVELYNSVSAVASARDIQDAKKARGCSFKLSIFPPLKD
ncbi:putative late blight resistance protein homolog R1A-10 [Salvia miltiorrhiza]|uniref:putative late blight resistance protein homolog R1A-10 n=1 Tax=Salvia miltiorrhiza TaxID=226208 RepID=UPI0025ABB681|nr:putative late blight resistance protein homolog R1A-10 [Salvia miltiorrhiza]